MERRISQRFLVTNMVKPERLPRIQQRLAKFHLEYLGDIPYDLRLENMIFDGEPLKDLSEGPAIEAIEKILKHIDN